MRQLRQLAWPCIVAGLIIALTWPIYVEGVRSDALAQASLLVLLPEASTVSLANQLDRVAVLKGFRDAHALNIPAGVALGAALALLGAFVVTRRRQSQSAPRLDLIDIRPVNGSVRSKDVFGLAIRSVTLASTAVMWSFILAVVFVIGWWDRARELVVVGRAWYVCMFRHRALSVPDDGGCQTCRCGREWLIALLLWIGPLLRSLAAE